MDIVESDLKQLFMWIKNLDELCKSQQVLIEVLDERVSNIEQLDAPDISEKRINDIEHDLALVLSSIRDMNTLVLSVIKDRKDST